MQVQKEEIRAKIRVSATKEFKEKGYEKASMRAIACQADISVGNLYRYFSNKHDLFSFIVGAIYEEMIRKMKIEYKMLYLDVNFLEHLEIFKVVANKRQGGFKDELYILLEKSKGSEYQDFKTKLISRLEEIITNNIISEVNKDKVIVQGKLFAKAFAASFVEGVSKIIIEAKDHEEFALNMVQYIELEFKSTIRTLIAMRDGNMNFRRVSYEEIFDNIHNNCNS